MVDEEEMTDIGYTVIDKAWSMVFDSLNILNKIDENGIYTITAKEMKKYSNNFEPRNMAKFESKNNLPELFKKYKLMIMPCDSRGHYVIGSFDAFTEVNYKNIAYKEIPLKKKYDILDPKNFTREPPMILASANYGILDEIANGQHVDMTDFGRQSSGKFDFLIKNNNGSFNSINVNGAQIELDGVFESDDYVISIEAKNSTRGDFLTRQLYYPYRMLRERTDKDIINVFMSYSVGNLYIHKYLVEVEECYNSMKLIGSHCYIFVDKLTKKRMIDIISSTTVEQEPIGPSFPQADSMQKVIEVASIVYGHPDIIDVEVGYKMNIDPRQGGYYANACAYLGLISRNKKHRPATNNITSIGIDFLLKKPEDQVIMMVRLLAKHLVFNKFILEALKGEPASKNEISDWIRENVPKLDPKKGTPGRRAQTVVKWIEWVTDYCSDKE